MRYINIWDYKDRRFPFQIFIGGRGTGKTFSGLSGALDLFPDKFIFMRRTAQELDLMLDSEKYGEGANPFKPVNKVKDRNVGMAKIVKNLAGIYNRDMIDGKEKPVGSPIGYGVALSTISTIRGIDFSDCTDCIYDEFIPEKHVRKMKNEGGALLNAYETICRNREFTGDPPLNLWLLANSNDIYNDIFIELGIVSDIEKMVRKKITDKYFKDRGLAVHLIGDNGDFVDAKSNTALYKLTRGSQFADMALNNKFAYNDFSLIKHESVVGMRPLCAIGKAFIYVKKGQRNIYISYAPARIRQYNIDLEQDRKDFYNEFGNFLYKYFLKSCVTFESYELKQTILDLIL